VGCLLRLLLSAKFGKPDIFQSADVAPLWRHAQRRGPDHHCCRVGGLQRPERYGGMLNLITGLATFVRVHISFRIRLLMMLPTFIVGTAAA
jgi:NCS1 family nucleobase:cation symporter-1